MYKAILNGHAFSHSFIWQIKIYISTMVTLFFFPSTGLLRPIPLLQYKEAFDDSESEPVMKLLMWFVCACVFYFNWMVNPVCPDAQIQNNLSVLIWRQRSRWGGWGAGQLSGADVIPGALRKLTLFPICPVFQGNHTSLANHPYWIGGVKPVLS